MGNYQLRILPVLKTLLMITCFLFLLFHTYL